MATETLRAPVPVDAGTVDWHSVARLHVYFGCYRMTPNQALGHMVDYARQITLMRVKFYE